MSAVAVLLWPGTAGRAEENSRGLAERWLATAGGGIKGRVRASVRQHRSRRQLSGDAAGRLC